MTNMSSHYITVLERELHYTEWGQDNAATVILWHGLARTGRDFDDLAAALARRYRVICPDTIGRVCPRERTGGLFPQGVCALRHAHRARMDEAHRDFGAARARVVEIAGCGHAPALNVPAQIGPVEEFLAG